jgi:NADP-dependent 3-hydroxy acid dehydrogenase YdfG
VREPEVGEDFVLLGHRVRKAGSSCVAARVMKLLLGGGDGRSWVARDSSTINSMPARLADVDFLGGTHVNAERLDGTVALVTGASSGIGEATALSLAGQGAAVAVAARRKDRLDALAAIIRERGGTALVLETDVTDEHQASYAVERTVAELGRLDTLVNNAGVMLLGPAVGAPITEWQRMVQLNVLGLLYCAHAALPHLLRAAEASPRQVADMVNISSVAGRQARSGSGVYNATKHGVGAFSESLRQEVTRRHVRVSLVEPGAVATELASHNRPEIKESMRVRFASIERMQAEDIAEAITYIVTRPRRVAVNEMLIRPTEQEM